jgi:hypothetical protein
MPHTLKGDMMSKSPVTVAELTKEVYECGQYLKREFKPAELRVPGQFPGDTVGTDIRLQLHDGTWSFHTGDSQYDQDHRGAWGSGFCPRGVSKAEARSIAKDLIDEAMSDYAEMMDNEDEDTE